MKTALILVLMMCLAVSVNLNRKPKRPEYFPMTLEAAMSWRGGPQMILPAAEKVDYTAANVANEAWRTTHRAPEGRTLGAGVPGLNIAPDTTRAWTPAILSGEDAAGIYDPENNAEAVPTSLSLTMSGP